MAPPKSLKAAQAACAKLESAKNNLKKQAHVERKKCADDKKNLEATIQELKEEQERSALKITELQTKVESLNTEKASLQERFDLAKTEHEEKYQKLQTDNTGSIEKSQAMEKMLEDVRIDTQKVKSDLAEEMLKVKHLQEEKEKMKNELNQYYCKYEEKKKFIADMKNTIGNLENDVKTGNNKIVELEKNLLEQKNLNVKESRRVINLEKEINDNLKEIGKLQSLSDEKGKTLKELQALTEKLERKKLSMEEQNSKLKDEIDKLKNDVDYWKSEEKRQWTGKKIIADQKKGMYKSMNYYKNMYLSTKLQQDGLLVTPEIVHHNHHPCNGGQVQGMSSARPWAKYNDMTNASRRYGMEDRPRSQTRRSRTRSRSRNRRSQSRNRSSSSRNNRNRT